MSVTTGIGNMRRAGKDLRVRWGEVRSVWYDQNSQRFEAEHLAPLLARLRTVELTMGHIATVLHRVRRDCE